jgi:hypothetical protein
MAIVSTGYDGTIDEAAWSQMAPAVGSADYGVVGYGDWKVSIVSGQDRTVSIATGAGWGKGVFDASDSIVTIQLATISSGSRWDMIVMRRDWSGAGGTSEFTKIQGTSSKSLPSRNANPGTLDDQPLALVQVTAGQTTPTAIVDLRCWGGNGGMTASDMLALQYLDRPGGQLTIGTKIYANTGASAGSTPSWREIANMSGVNLFGVGGQVPGNPTPPASGNGFLMQAGSATITTDANGYARITWPVPFPNGCLTAMCQNGNEQFWGAMSLGAASTSWGASPINKTYGVWWPTQNIGGVNKNYPNKTIRLNYIAIGW